MSAEVMTIAGIILLTHTAGATLGFGATVLALPFVALVLNDARTTVQLLVAMTWVNVAFVLLLGGRELKLRPIVPIFFWTALAMPFGFLLFWRLPERLLHTAIGATVVAVSVFEAVRQYRGRVASAKTQRMGLIDRLCLVGSGAMHGAFGIGGPLLVVYAVRAIPDKTQFRLSLCFMWLVLNSLMMGGYVGTGQLSADVWVLIAWCAPVCIASAAVGHYCHKRIDSKTFRYAACAVMGLSGAAMLWR